MPIKERIPRTIQMTFTDEEINILKWVANGLEITPTHLCKEIILNKIRKCFDKGLIE